MASKKSFLRNQEKPADRNRLPAGRGQAMQNDRRVKLRWSSLLLLGTIAFIVLSNTPSEVPPAAAKNNGAERQKPNAENGGQTEREKQKADQPLAAAQPMHAVGRLEKIAVPSLAPAAEKDHEGLQSKGGKTRWVVRPGDTLSSVLDHFNVHSALPAILSSPGHKPLLKLLPGRLVELFTEQGRLTAIRYYKNTRDYLSLSRQSGNRFLVENHRLKTELRQAYASGVVKSSFYAAGLEARLSDRTILNVAKVLAWDLDFILDVRSGDYFSVVYEEEYLDGEKIGDGKVLGVDFHNNGKIHRAVRYTPVGGRPDYYTPEGKIMRKAFLRAPLQFTRVSSRFSPARVHPVYKTIRPHRGVDYGAAIGTPVYAAGDGRVAFRGRKSGYGNVVIVRHAGIYSTLYAHLSKFASGQTVGTRVRQGQVIGYVGMTGVATGPHLHYEFRVHGVHKDPLLIKFPPAKSLPSSEMPRFTKAVAGVQAQLDVLGRTFFASRQTSR